MDKDQKFDKQEAPLKNTDNAFVQVSEDGSPAIPDNINNEQSQEDIQAEQQRKEAMSERD